MKIYPEKAKNLDINKIEKRIASFIKSKLGDDYIGIHQTNLSGESDDCAFAIISRRGLILIKFSRTKTLTDFAIPYIQEAANSYMERVKTRLSTIKNLVDDSGELIFPIRIITVYSEISSDEAKEMISSSEFMDNHARYSDWIKDIQIDAISVFNELLSLKKCEDLPDKYIDAIINKIDPSCTHIRANNLEITTKKVGKAFFNDQIIVNQNDKVVDIFRLDDTQINYVNNIKKGHQLILACAGSGKSVILISKCFKVASLDNSKQYLITCYNRNLANFYNWQIDEAGFRERNVECKSFHSLCLSLLKKNDLYHFNESIHGVHAEYVYEATRKGILTGKITERYYGVFIDEVQIFDPRWYKLCFSLLDNNDKDDHIFVICGDLTQNVKKYVKRGQAPWQGDPDLPAFVGRSIRIETNYRNSIEINNYINAFSLVVQKYFKRLDFNKDLDQDIFLRGKAIRNGFEPMIFNCAENTTHSESNRIIESINYMHDVQDIPYTEIAVLFYRASGKFIKGWQKYYLGRNVLIDNLDKNHINYDFLAWNDSQKFITSNYSDRTGVSLLTNEGALGLDFRGIIIAGLPTMSQNGNIYTESNINSELQKDNFVNCINSMYLACSRAKDSLHIILPNTTFKSIYSDIFRESFEEYSSNNGVSYD